MEWFEGTRGRVGRSEAGERSQKAFGSSDLRLDRQALVARLMREAATEDKVQQVCEQLMDKAAAGDIEAASLVFEILAMGEGSDDADGDYSLSDDDVFGPDDF